MMEGGVTKELRSWLPRLGSSEFVVLIEGLVWDNGKQRRWRSGPISVRIESNLLQATSGSRYKLVGRLDHQMCAELYYPLPLVHSFKHGFPEDWEPQLLELYNFLKEKSTALSVRNISSITSKTKTPKKKIKKKEESTIKVTRSGRLSRPPLAGWANQRIIHDIEGNPIEATGITTKTKFNKNETPKLGPVCQQLGLKPPSPTVFAESRIDSPVIKKPKKKNNSQLDYDSVDEESLTGCEDFLTPIVPRKKESKKPRNVLESGSESDEKEDTIIERKSRKRRIESVDKKKSKGPKNLKKTIKFPKANITIEEDPQVDCIVEYPESEEEESIKAGPQIKKRWLKKEKDFFLRTLKMLKPKTDREWAATIQSLGYPGPFEEYKEVAKNFGWIHPDEKAKLRNEVSHSIDSENNENVLNATIAEEAALTARPGTAAYAVQIDRLTRKLKPKENPQLSTPAGSKPLMSSSSPPITLDRSMLDLLMSPEVKLPVPRMHFQPSLQVSTPKTPGSAEESRTSVNMDISPITERQREQMIRRIHQAYAPSKKYNKTRNNSRMQTINSTYFESTSNRFNFNQFSRSTKPSNSDLLPEEMEEEEALYSEDEMEEI